MLRDLSDQDLEMVNGAINASEPHNGNTNVVITTNINLMLINTFVIGNKLSNSSIFINSTGKQYIIGQ